MNWEEACQILGVPITATKDEIRAQYIYKAQLLHPDKTIGLPENVRSIRLQLFSKCSFNPMSVIGYDVG